MKKKNNNLLNAVIEIEEVEYLIDRDANDSIRNDTKDISLVRLIDGEKRIFSRDIILKSIAKSGIIDRLG